MSDHSNAGIRSRTCVVTVTYGDRYHLLERTVLAVLKEGAGKVLVVNNGSADQSAQALRDLAAANPDRLQILDLPKNLGSAAGYESGLNRAVSAADEEFIWLLDDDNMPVPGAFEQLVNRYQTLETTIPRDRLAALAYRESRVMQRRLVQGESVATVFPRVSSCLGWHILDMPNKIRRKLARAPVAHGPQPAEGIELPWCPYGGLFLHRSALTRAGMPDRRFFVYADDTDFSYRFTTRGGRIFLVASSRIEDIDESWYLAEKSWFALSAFITSSSDFRVYYSVRNQVYFESRFRRESAWLYRVNRFAVMAFFWASARRHRKSNRLRLILQAVRDGLTGKLGEAAQL